MEKITLESNSRSQIIDITSAVQSYVAEQEVISGIVVVYSPHTTAGITVNENADPDVKSDLLKYLDSEVPQDYGFDHLERNSDSHIKGSIMNFSQTFIIENGQVQLGTWQGIYFCEFDGPRQRQVWLKIV